MIKAVIFDVDGVLINTFEANVKFYQELMIRNGYPPPTREEYKKLFSFAMIDAIKILTKSEDEKIIQKIFEMGADRKSFYPFELVTAPEKMKDTVITLSKGYILGIVTNKLKKNIFEIKYMKDIENYFQDIVAADDAVKHKPDPEPLLLMLQKMNIISEEAIYIGDSKTDFQAAQAAGIKFILFPKSDIEDIEISTNNFEELPEIIKNII